VKKRRKKKKHMYDCSYTHCEERRKRKKKKKKHMYDDSYACFGIKKTNWGPKKHVLTCCLDPQCGLLVIHVEGRGACGVGGVSESIYKFVVQCSFEIAKKMFDSVPMLDARVGVQVCKDTLSENPELHCDGHNAENAKLKL
jgi:hypothetical protein